jgi:hypothetical protein
MKRALFVGASVTLIAAALAAGVVAAVGSGPSAVTVDRAAVAARLLKTALPRYMTSPAQMALRMSQSGTRTLSPSPATLSATGRATGGSAAIGAGLPNVRVNDPAEDSHEIDQTTQSETAIAVHGSNVAVGFNDSQHTLLALTAASSLTGYAYSNDGGATFRDGGSLANPAGMVNFGDPWLTSDRGGNMYFANLALDGVSGNLDVSVTRSTDGGKTWGTPVAIVRPGVNVFYNADKDALTAGRDPAVAGRDDLYAAWDDFSAGFTGPEHLGLAVAHSTDGGATWHLTYADRTELSFAGCSFRQYIGAQPLVDPSNGTLYVAAERISVDDPTCSGLAPTLSEWIFRSTDGGRTFGKGVKIADTAPATPSGLLELGPGQDMRTAEFPSLAMVGGTLYAAWNDGASGRSHIRMAASTDGGATWKLSWVTQGGNDEVQPELSADTALHVMYYRRNANDTLDVFVSDSPNGSSFTTQRVTNQSSPGVLTLPQFDPIIAPAYMGDYIANVSDGGHQYLAWGDNRDVVTNFLWPSGRHDPDVFFAKR